MGTPNIKIMVEWVLKGTRKWGLICIPELVCIKVLVYLYPSLLFLKGWKTVGKGNWDQFCIHQGKYFGSGSMKCCFLYLYTGFIEGSVG